MDQKKELAYYLTCFKIEGHTTWRAELKQDPEGFERARIGQKFPAVTEKRVIRIDRITGEVKPL